MFDYPPGFHQVCPICGWEDNLAQLRFPLMPGAPNAVKWAAFQHFAPLIRWVSLGGSTGDPGTPTGLDAFKRGWSNQTRKSYFCGKILNPKAYAELAAKQAALDPAWFPAYRSGDY